MPFGFWLALLVQASILVLALLSARNFLHRALEGSEDGGPQ